jgi:hypothetical protein
MALTVWDVCTFQTLLTRHKSGPNSGRDGLFPLDIADVVDIIPPRDMAGICGREIKRYQTALISNHA